MTVGNIKGKATFQSRPRKESILLDMGFLDAATGEVMGKLLCLSINHHFHKRLFCKIKLKTAGYIGVPGSQNPYCIMPPSSKISTIFLWASLTASSGVIRPVVMLAIIWLGMDAAKTASAAALGRAG